MESFQFSVFIAHRSSLSLLPAQPLPIAALRQHSAAIEPDPESTAMTKSTVKQALNASPRRAGTFQLQR
jgi:hypothetical protein